MRSNLVQLGFRAQRKEKLLGHLAKCFMEFSYPSKKLLPSEFKEEISDVISALERSKKCYQKLEKYKDIMYGYSPFNDFEVIDSKLSTLKQLENNYIFPTKKTNEQYPVRIFIIHFLSHFIPEIARFKGNEILRLEFNYTFEFKDVLTVIEILLGFDCFDPSQIPNNVNVRKIINDELDRRRLCLTLKNAALESSMVGQQVLIFAGGKLEKVVQNYQGIECLKSFQLKNPSL